MRTQTGHADKNRPAEQQAYRRLLQGSVLALLLTLLPFGVVHWNLVQAVPALVFIIVCALVQAAVHLRFFLQLDLSERREELLLMLFSAVLLIVMAGGTIWIMFNLAGRMTMPM